LYAVAINLQILLDDVDIRELDVAWLRAQFGLVSQEPDLFADTLEYNILYGKPDAELHSCDPTAPSEQPKSASGG
jgi:ATP-binding cassette subfamily B (MDR/TAP) protein 1